MNIGDKNVKVISRDGKHNGHTTGGSRMCQLEGCTGRSIAVRWDDGKLTYPCTKGMTWNGDHWKID